MLIMNMNEHFKKCNTTVVPMEHKMAWMSKNWYYVTLFQKLNEMLSHICWLKIWAKFENTVTKKWYQQHTNLNKRQNVKIMSNCFKTGAETISDMLIRDISLIFKNIFTENSPISNNVAFRRQELFRNMLNRNKTITFESPNEVWSQNY